MNTTNTQSPNLNPTTIQAMLQNDSLVRCIRGHLSDLQSENTIAVSLLHGAVKRFSRVSLDDCRCVVMTVAETAGF